MAAAGTKLVIVESPTKARTIRQFLGKDFRVEASMGHVRDLPSNADEIPEEIKKKSWARIGVNTEDGSFEPVYVVPDDKKKVVTELRRAVREASELYVATDEDREGESIGWHLLEVLKPKIPTHRMVFHEITPGAIQAALASPRAIDAKLVQAQEARRIIDRLVGYVVSPLLWKKVAPRLSAGRVQSVAVRILVLRERERMAFRVGSSGGLRAAGVGSPTPSAAPRGSWGGGGVAPGRDFDETTGRLRDESANVALLGETDAKALATRLAKAAFTVTNLDTKPATRSPYPPFTTSTLQQEANRKLGWTSRQTMQVAQKLYENGYITYMRTDSVHLSGEAISAAQSKIRSLYGADYLYGGATPKARQYETKSKGAQEAHEAIRPAGTEMKTVEELRLSGLDARLYELIWKRTVATQMADARLRFVNATIVAQDPERGPAEFRASGREVVFPGFFRAYVEGSDDPDSALDDQSRPLPALKQDEQVPCRGVDASGHETKPPARYTEATLVKALEAEGIGRPSTYATIIDTVQRRGYVFAANKQLVPTFTAFAVTSLLERTLGRIVDTEFTAAMESRLDDISDAGSAGRYLSGFYSEELVPGVDRGGELDPRAICTVASEKYAPWSVRVGRYGPYAELPQEGDAKPLTVTVPEDIPPADLTREMLDALASGGGKSEGGLGQDPATGLPVYLLNGRYGWFVQLGESDDKGAKPKRTSLPKGVEPAKLTLADALRLLALPRELGKHPDDGELVKAGIGQYGPYVVHGKTYASLKGSDDVLRIELPRALELLAEKLAGGGRGARGARAAAAPLRELGVHPADGKPVVVLDGRYGPYVQHEKTNATLPKGTDIAALTLDEALALVAAKAAAGPKKPARGRAPARRR